MTAIFDEVTISWGDKTYTVTPDFSIVQAIEQKYSIARLLLRLETGDAPLSHVADVLSMALEFGGYQGDRTKLRDQVHQDLWWQKQAGEDAFRSAVLFLNAMSPNPPETDGGNNSSSTTKKMPRSPAKKTSKKSRGRSTTK